ncbi:MAG: hypothetical protein EP323_00360 [Gammaproteobacteria bacterium]|nr:MAG: hypothetical protein EP334_00525 [Gammaproteobacteria bacterium]TNF09386.1 MAG: hypothetical protein EP323_00360 [Gammaproteobacteria bacterium]
MSEQQKTTEAASPSQEPVVMAWIECHDWSDLPEGEWLVKITKVRNPYHIASATTKTGAGHKMIIVGNCFHFDMGEIVAYSPFVRYEP